MELKEILKIIKDNFKIITVFMALGGLIAAGVVASRPVEYQGNFVIYLNKATPPKEFAQSYNDFYALQSLSQVADFLVEWAKKFDADRPEFELKLKKKTTLFLESSLISRDAVETKRFFNEFVNSATRHIIYFNERIFSESFIDISFSDFKITEVKMNFWRYFGAGIFGGLILGIFIIFLKQYFKN